MIEHPKFDGYDLGSLALIISAGAPLPYQIARDVERMMGAPIVQFYGSVDSGIGFTNSPEDLQETRLLTVGKAVLGVEAKLLDDNGAPVSEGETGEVVARFSRDFTGYFKDLKSTLQSWTSEGWFKMGLVEKIIGKGGYVLGEWEDKRINGTIDTLIDNGPKYVATMSVVAVGGVILFTSSCSSLTREEQEDQYNRIKNLGQQVEQLQTTTEKIDENTISSQLASEGHVK